MRCGEKCFLVHLEEDDQKKTVPINARTPAEARKFFRAKYGPTPQIVSVLQKERKRTI